MLVGSSLLWTSVKFSRLPILSTSEESIPKMTIVEEMLIWNICGYFSEFQQMTCNLVVEVIGIVAIAVRWFLGGGASESCRFLLL